MKHKSFMSVVALLSLVVLLGLISTMMMLPISAEAPVETEVASASEEPIPSEALESEYFLFSLTAEDLAGENLAYTLSHLDTVSYILLGVFAVLAIALIIAIIVIVKRLLSAFSYV